MKNNVFVKSVLRQRVRSLLLFILIGLAAFVFVLRTAEFMVVRNQIMEIAGFYRAVGFLNTDTLFGDVSGAIETLENSPYVATIEQRRTATAFLRDFSNADFEGRGTDQMQYRMLQYSSFFTASRYAGTSPQVTLLAIDRARNTLIPEGVSVTLGEELDPRRVRWQTYFSVHDVLVGHAEHVVPDQLVKPLLHVTLLPSPSIFAGMTFDGQYFVRALYNAAVDSHMDGLRPMAGWPNLSQIVPLNWEQVTFYGAEPIYFIRLQYGETLDLAAHGLEHLYQIMESMEQAQRAMTLRTTSDMATLPTMLGGQPTIRIIEGRHITPDDYENARPVAVINNQFARFRGLAIGDTFVVTVPVQQQFSRIYAAGLFSSDPTGLEPGAGFDPTVVETFTYIDLLVTGNEDELAYEIELEIVGKFVYAIPLATSRLTMPIYIPDSIMPADFVVLPPTNPVGIMTDWTYGHIPDSWLSFTLVDSRYEQDFFLQYGPIFAEMGLRLVIIGADSSNFWAVATPLLTVITFNAVVFWIVLVIVLALAVFLYLRSRIRYFAISRALGTPAASVVKNLLVSVLVLGLPAIAIGGYVAWAIALTVTGDTLAPLAGMVEGIEIVPDLHVAWLAVLMGIVLVAMVIMSLAGAVYVLKRPVLELLQGRLVSKRGNRKGRKEKRRDGGDGLYSRLGFGAGWVLRHIIRQPLKTLLSVAVAVLFMLSLGWLQEAITRGQDGIDTLYDTTIVYVDVLPAERPPSLVGSGAVGSANPAFYVGGVIRSTLVNQVRESSFSENIFTEAAHLRAFLLPLQPNNEFPLDWADIIGYDLTRPIAGNLGALDFLYAFSDFDSFVFEHSRGFEDRFFDDIYVEFHHAFDGGMFAADTIADVMPVVLYQGTMERRGINLGDMLTLAYTRGMLTNHDMRTRQVVVAGTHNGEINRDNLRQAVLLPQAYLDNMLGMMSVFSTLNFTVNPGYNREIEDVREVMEYIVPRGGLATLGLFFLDEELRNAVVAMEQSMLVLEMLYPIAVMLCIAIGAALAMLLAMQSDKNVAILRVLGTTKSKTCAVLIIEQLIVCVVGILIGAAIVNGLGWGFGIVALGQVAAAYLAGTIVGLVVGAVKATSKAPIDLLQVRD